MKTAPKHNTWRNELLRPGYMEPGTFACYKAANEEN